MKSERNFIQNVRFGLALACVGAGGLLGGCGGTSVGNPLTEPVNIQSAPYANASLLELAERFFLMNTARATAVSELKFCVTKIKLSNESDESVLVDGSAEIEAKLGLIDISNASATKSWGSVKIPVNFDLKELRVEIHKDAELCMEEYALSYNGITLGKDLEFRFEFNPVVHIHSNDTLILGMSNLAQAIESASQAGALSDQDIDRYLDASVKGSGSK